MSKFLSYLMIAYAFISLILLTNIQNNTQSIENDNIAYWTPEQIIEKEEFNGYIQGIVYVAMNDSSYGTWFRDDLYIYNSDNKDYIMVEHGTNQLYIEIVDPLRIYRYDIINTIEYNEIIYYGYNVTEKINLRTNNLIFNDGYFKYDKNGLVQINYSPNYDIITYDEPNGVLSGMLNSAKAISDFGRIQLFNTGINTGYEWLDKMLNITVLPVNVVINMTKLVFKIVYAITGMDFQNGGSADTSNINWDNIWNPNSDGHGGSFSSGSSYGGGGGGAHGGR